jgi:hypothetical protein
MGGYLLDTSALAKHYHSETHTLRLQIDFFMTLPHRDLS